MAAPPRRSRRLALKRTSLGDTLVKCDPARERVFDHFSIVELWRLTVVRAAGAPVRHDTGKNNAGCAGTPVFQCVA